MCWRGQTPAKLPVCRHSIAPPGAGGARLQNQSPARLVGWETIYHTLILAHAVLTPPARAVPRVSRTSDGPETQQNELSF